jgi:Zn-dependent protease with chaperone function
MINFKLLFELSKKYITLKLELFKCSLQTAVLALFATVILWLLFLIPATLFIFFCSFLAGWYLGEVLQNVSLGFLIVTSFYFASALIIYLRRNAIKRYFYNVFLELTRDFFEAPIDEPLNLKQEENADSTPPA